MRLLANENFPTASVKYLSQKGFDISAIGTDNMSISDREVMTIAINEKRIILTFDRDYGELIFKHSYLPDMGVIYFRISVYEPDEPGKMTEALLNDPDFSTSRKLTVINTDGIRQRGY